MFLPEYLKIAIEEELSGMKGTEIARLTQELSSRYREEAPSHFMANKGHRLAYLAFRFPATFGAVSRVLLEIVRKFPEEEIFSMLDAGAGPGTATFAASEVFTTLKGSLLFERDQELIGLGKRLMQRSSLPFSLEWKNGDLCEIGEIQPKDLVILSYSIGEIQEPYWDRLLSKLWDAATKFLIIIEPGTPAGFSRIRKIREKLISWEGKVVAPCPHQYRCPMQEGDWCHFAQRIERSSLHRKAKEGSLGYEDEKFSYVIFSKLPSGSSQDRILRHPIKNPGYVSLTLCTKEGLKQKIVSKKDKEGYRLARKAAWGDVF